jgi:hypothetical protein
MVSRMIKPPTVKQPKIGDSISSKHNNYFAKYDGCSWLICKNAHGLFLFRVYLRRDANEALDCLEKLKGGVSSV